MSLENRVLQIMCNVFEVEGLEPDVSQRNCARWDSLHHLTLASELEDEFGIDLEPEEIAEMTDFDRVIGMLRSKDVE